MSNTQITMNTGDLKRFAKGYNKNGELTSYWDCAEFVPAGGLRSTLNDMMKYMQYNCTDKPLITLAHEKTYGTLDDGVALGWGINQPKKDQLLFWHEGSTGGFRAMCAILPSSRSGVVILTNSKADIGKLTSDLVKLLLK